MADPQLRLFFTGLCGLVPSTKSATPADPSKDVAVAAVRVLLAEGRGLHSGHGGASQPAHEYHEPVLKVRSDYVVSGSAFRPPDMSFTPPGPSSPTWAIYLLGDEDLTIDWPGTGVDFPKPWTSIPNPMCPSMTDRDKLEWVAPVKDIGGLGIVHRDCLGGGHSSVAARVRLTQGRLTTARFARDQGIHNDKILEWNFRKNDGNNPLNKMRAVSEAVKLQLTFTGSTIDLITTPGNRVIQLRHKPSPNPGDPDLVACSILNMPWPDILRVRPAMNTERPHDSHFELFYEMLTNPAGAVSRVPYPDPRQHCTGSVADPDPAVSNPQCPPALYDPHIDA